MSTSTTTTYSVGNNEIHRVSIRAIVSDPQFTSGYRAKLEGLPPPRFYYDEEAGERCDTWGYERGRKVATWLLATGQKPPGANDIRGLVMAFLDAAEASAVL